MDSTDISLPGAPADAPQTSSRRRMVGAGLAGLAGSLLPMLAGRAGASAPPDTDPDSDSPVGPAAPTDATGPDDTDPAPPIGGTDPLSTDAPTGGAATTTTAPPKRPTTADVELLSFAQSIEIATMKLYDLALRTGSIPNGVKPVVTAIREAHQAYANSLSGLLGKVAPDSPDETILDDNTVAFTDDDPSVVYAAASGIESSLVATHLQILGELDGTDAAQLVASILVVEARHAAILTDMSGDDDLDAQLTSDAEAFEPAKG